MLLMPRLASLRETRNEHQTATVNRLGHLQGIKIAKDEKELISELENFNYEERPIQMGSDASPRLIQRLQQFIEEG